DPFFEKPGKMLVKDGIYYLQVTINKADWSMIKNLTIDGKELKITEVNGKVLVQVKLGKSIPKELLLDMFIEVPGLYEENHLARLVLDRDSLVETEEALSIITDETDLSAGKTPGKPKFGANDENEKEETVVASNTNNPKTGDNTQVILYGLLFASSL